MKGDRKSRSTGGVNEAERDLAEAPSRRINDKEIFGAAEERKKGGRVGRKAKNVGNVMGAGAASHAGRKPRKAGGRAYSDENPFTSARSGTPAKGRKLSMEMDGGPGEV